MTAPAFKIEVAQSGGFGHFDSRSTFKIENLTIDQFVVGVDIFDSGTSGGQPESVRITNNTIRGGSHPTLSTYGVLYSGAHNPFTLTGNTILGPGINLNDGHGDVGVYIGGDSSVAPGNTPTNSSLSAINSNTIAGFDTGIRVDWVRMPNLTISGGTIGTASGGPGDGVDEGIRVWGYDAFLGMPPSGYPPADSYQPVLGTISTTVVAQKDAISIFNADDILITDSHLTAGTGNAVLLLDSSGTTIIGGTLRSIGNDAIDMIRTLPDPVINNRVRSVDFLSQVGMPVDIAPINGLLPNDPGDLDTATDGPKGPCRTTLINAA